MKDRTGNDHCTPVDIVEFVKAVTGVIDLDPCSNPWSKVNAFHNFSLHGHNGIGPASDGLEESWSIASTTMPLVYVNPPYGRGHIIRWVDKIVAECTLNSNLSVMLLVPGDDSTKWAKEARKACDAYCDPDDRIPFEGAGGGGAKAASRLYYFGPLAHRFASVMLGLGAVRVLDRREHVVELRAALAAANEKIAMLKGMI